MAYRRLSYDALRRQRVVLAGLVLALVVVMLWVIIELTTSHSSSQVEAELQELAQPLNPTLDTDVLEQIQSYEYISPQEARRVIQEQPIRIYDKDGVLTLISGDGSEATTAGNLNTQRSVSGNDPLLEMNGSVAEPQTDDQTESSTQSAATQLFNDQDTSTTNEGELSTNTDTNTTAETITNTTSEAITETTTDTTNENPSQTATSSN